jgi:carbonic anhydrase
METFTDDQLRQKLSAATGADTSDIEFHSFPTVRDRVRESVATIAESPLLPDSFTARGFVYDVRTGQLDEVV